MTQSTLKIIGFIPARYQSTRFPGKPLAFIKGKPMIQHVYERSCAAKRLDGVFIATDDQRIYQAVKGFGGQVMLTSSNHSSGTDRVAEAAQKTTADIIINIQGDEPLIQPEAIDLLAVGMSQTKVPVATLKRKITQLEDLLSPNCVKVVTNTKGLALYFSRAPIPFARDRDHFSSPSYQHIGIYAYRRNFLQHLPSLPSSPLEQAEKLEQLRFLEHGYKILVLETSYTSYGVDTPEDIGKIEKLLDFA